MLTTEDLRRIVLYIGSLGDLVEEDHRDTFSRIVLALINPERPETIEAVIQNVEWAGATIGYLEARWRAKERDAKIQLESAQAAVARSFREVQKTLGNKVTESLVDQEIAASPKVIDKALALSRTTEVADIFQSVRYAIKNRHDGLLEASRNERQNARN